MDQIEALHADLLAVRSAGRSRDESPRSSKLVLADIAKKAKKMGEEAVEVAIEAVLGHRRKTIEESADLIYNLVVLWEGMGIGPGDVWEEMGRRRAELGIAEKLPKAPAAEPAAPDPDGRTPWRKASRKKPRVAAAG